MAAPKLILTGDILRPFRVGKRWESATWKNVRWLDGLVGSAARLAGWDVSTVSWDPALRRARGHVDVPAIYDDLGVPMTYDGWASLSSRPDLPETVESTIRALFEGADLVVGYEMHEHLLRILDRAGIPVVDVILHPIRFLDDVIYALRSNRPEIHALLTRHAVSREAMILHAGLIKAKAAWMPPPLPLAPGAALILGQVATDPALIDPVTGTFKTLADYTDTLLDLCVNSSMVLFKPHPYDWTQSQTSGPMRRLQSVIWTKANFYHLLAQPEIDTVCALNSSGLVEAEFFGKEAVWLKPLRHRYGETPPAGHGGFGEAVPQDGSWCHPGFWSAIRGADEALTSLPPRPNRLRRALNADWGFSAMDRVVA